MKRRKAATAWWGGMWLHDKDGLRGKTKHCTVVISFCWWVEDQISPEFKILLISQLAVEESAFRWVCDFFFQWSGLAAELFKCNFWPFEQLKLSAIKFYYIQ